jgi:hypothetical protein
MQLKTLAMPPTCARIITQGVVGARRRNTCRRNHQRTLWHEPDLGDHLARPDAVHDQGEGQCQFRCLIEFLKRLITGAARPIFLIVDRGPAHIAKKTKAFVAGLGGKLRLFYLPSYSPDRNPDELVWKHLKADTVGRMAITDKADFHTKVRASMRQLQNDPEKIPSFCQKPSLKYAA